jgi:hypothetical protein
MCLCAKGIQKQVATEPLKVYKLLDVNNMPPYYPSEAYHVGINKPDTQPYAAGNGQWIGPGYLHAYTDKEHAMAAAKVLWWDAAYEADTADTVQYKLVEMYIPEGTAYYWDHIIGETAAEALEWQPESPVEILYNERHITDDLPF